jgi:hypothetical protein
VPSTCAITRPPHPPYTPPRPYPSKLPNNWFWFGTDKLWVGLPPDGTWSLGHYEPTNPAFRQKLIWYRNGYKAKVEPKSRLTVIGKRLDAWAPPMEVDGPNAAWGSGHPEEPFMTVGLNIPTTGCWEITGQYGEDKLSFVVWVEDGTRD